MPEQSDTSRRRKHDRGLWWLLGTALVAWAGSWRVIYLEVTRWHHMNSRLHFTPPPVPPGSPAPHAGLPVIMALTVAGAAPFLSILAATVLAVKPATRSRRKDQSE